jgi:hypothetical protein
MTSAEYFRLFLHQINALPSQGSFRPLLSLDKLLLTQQALVRLECGVLFAFMTNPNLEIGP